LRRADVAAVVAIVIHFFFIYAVTAGLSLPEWFIGILAGIVALYFADRAIQPEPSTFNIPVFVIRTILVLSSLFATLGWIAAKVTIPEFWAVYFLSQVGFYIPAVARRGGR